MRNLTQVQMIEKFGSIIIDQGVVYHKKGGVFAKLVDKTQSVDTVIAGIKETTNTANEGDFIIQNGTSEGEFYVLTADKLQKRYTISFEVEVPSDLLKEGFQYYKALGACKAIEYTEEMGSQEFHFRASWGEDMLCQVGDMLVSPINNGNIENEVYRIEKNSFRETYE